MVLCLLLERTNERTCEYKCFGFCSRAGPLGVTIISRPGSTPSINMRGRGNLGTSSPLFVIDGAIADASFFSSLDPNSIESISFLKDAASSAIYGSRAAYGVVLVKTKGGKEGDLKISYDGSVAVKMATYTPDVLGSEWYARLSNEAALNENPNTSTLPYTDKEIQMFRDGSNPDMYPNTNWYDLVLKDEAVMTKHSVSFSLVVISEILHFIRIYV